MSRGRVAIYQFTEGLQTTPSVQRSGPRGYETFQNVRNSTGPAAQRLGMKRVTGASAGSDASIIDFDGTNDYLTIAHDSRSTAFTSYSAFTISGLVQCDTLAAPGYIFSRDNATASLRDVTVYVDSTSGGRILADIRDSAGTQTLLQVTGLAASTIIAWSVVRSGSTVTLYANGSSSAGTISNGTLAVTSDNLLIGATGGPASFFNGRIEFVTGWNVARTSPVDGWSRLINPRALDVLFDYVTEIDSGTGYVLDRGRIENHADTAGSPTTTATLLGNPPVPVQCMAPILTRSNARRLIVVARGDVYTGTLS